MHYGIWDFMHNLLRTRSVPTYGYALWEFSLYLKICFKVFKDNKASNFDVENFFEEIKYCNLKLKSSISKFDANN